MSWVRKTLEDLCLKITDGSHNPPKGVEFSEYIMLSSKNVFDDQITFDNPRYLSKSDFDIENRRTDVNENDILLTIVGTVGRAAVVSSEAPKFTLQRSVAVLKPNQEFIHPRFLMYSLQNILDVLLSGARGVAQKGIYLKTIRETSINIPPLEEQKRIAAILDKADAIRRKRQQAIDLADQFLRSVFLDMFGDPVTNPKGFDVKPLSSLCDVRDGTHDSPKYTNEGYPLVTSKNLRDGNIDLSDVNYISEKDYDDINKRSKVETGDLIMPMIGTIGNPVRVDVKPNFAIKNVALIRTSDSKVNMTYVLHLLRSHYFEYITEKSNRGGTQKFISLGDIRNLPVPVPDEKLVKDFEKIVEKITSNSEKLLLSKEQTEKNFNALSQRSFCGDLSRQPKVA